MVQHHMLATHPAGKPLLSGGSTGPEGSVFVLAILVLIVLIILITLPKREYGYIRAGERRASLIGVGDV
jgi:hypothetical protein